MLRSTNLVDLTLFFSLTLKDLCRSRTLLGGGYVAETKVE